MSTLPSQVLGSPEVGVYLDHSEAGCDDEISQAAGARWSTSEPPVHSGIPCSSFLAGAPASLQLKTSMDADGEDVSQRFIGGRCCEGPGREAQGCVCVHGPREPEASGPCWPGSAYVYYGVRRNLVVGVEVVEEVAVEDTLEVIQLVTGLTFSGSILTWLGEMMNPRKETEVWNSHFSAFT
ncbi:hypothetical protein L3Q82_012932 [Scortum barcoo]|uniref:Uncharacterized protein n=1 Tax=Scortum barcoo TaxID=214431 RepID=A0ACB8W0W2_9TELE|nr:hypothetical protein L3Q82_012932 [Scortum barcoo]